MGTALATLISIALLLAGAALAAQGSFKSVGLLTEAWQQMETRTGQIGRTRLEVEQTLKAGSTVDVTLANTGQTPMKEFSSWDVIVEYYDQSGDYYQQRLPYTGSNPPGNNQWTVDGIYVDAEGAQAEVFQPGIFDPDEEMVITMKLSPSPQASGDGFVVVGTFNGVTVSTMF